LPFAAQAALGLFALPMLVELGMKRRFKQRCSPPRSSRPGSRLNDAYNAFVLGSLVPMSKRRVGLDQLRVTRSRGSPVDRPEHGLVLVLSSAVYCLVCLRPGSRSMRFCSRRSACW
jgi:hypothetical protein